MARVPQPVEAANLVTEVVTERNGQRAHERTSNAREGPGMKVEGGVAIVSDSECPLRCSLSSLLTPPFSLLFIPHPPLAPLRSAALFAPPHALHPLYK